MFDTVQMGNRIKELRKKHGLTQQAFSEKLHVSFQAVSNWERGIAPPDLENLLRIATFFGVLADDLLRSSPERLLLGIDGGGTKTEFAVTSPDGHVLTRFTLGRSNPNDIGFKNASETISEGIQKALIDFPSVTAVFGGIAGLSGGDYKKQMTQHLKKRFPTLKIQLETDSANLFAMDNKADMIVISGTGSVVFVRDKEKYTRLGGWGYLFDNAGSAYDIGRDAVSIVLTEEDFKESPGLIGELLRKELQVSRLWDAIDKLYDGGKPYIAALSKIVFEAYKKGDLKAYQIIERSAKHLGELINLGIKKYNAKPIVIAGGGIFDNYSHILLPHLKKYTEAQIVISGLPPVYGACRKCREILGGEISQSFYENFKESYGGQ